VILTRAGDSLRALDRLDEAEINYRAALKIEYDQYAVLGLALLQKARKDYTAALDTLNGVLNNDSGNQRLYQELAECYLALGQKDEARRILTEFQKRGQNNPYINDLMARLR
jgi:tetratricopeptide (TPR) repeat protein